MDASCFLGRCSSEWIRRLVEKTDTSSAEADRVGAFDGDEQCCSATFGVKFSSGCNQP